MEPVAIATDVQKKVSSLSPSRAMGKGCSGPNESSAASQAVAPIAITVHVTIGTVRAIVVRTGSENPCHHVRVAEKNIACSCRIT
jgi:hypothetical protein